MHNTRHVAKPTSAQTCELARITSKTETRVDTRLIAKHLGAAPAIHADRGTGGGRKYFARGVNHHVRYLRVKQSLQALTAVSQSEQRP